jgi:adenine-specific DNA methylase
MTEKSVVGKVVAKKNTMAGHSRKRDTNHGVCEVIRSPLRHLDVAAVNESARRESRNRELHLPPISVYRWWARRTESVNGAILDAFGKDHPGRCLIADPFSGGGVIALAAVVRGHRVYAQDLNPWATAGLAAMLSLPSPVEVSRAILKFQAACSDLIAAAYSTRFSDGTPSEISHTFRVATAACSACGHRERLFPHALVSLLQRKERGKTAAFLACPEGHLFLSDHSQKRRCPTCNRITDPVASYTEQRMITCQRCGHTEKLEQRAANGSWSWEIVLVERVQKGRREIAFPTPEEIQQADGNHWQPTKSLGPIVEGQETKVLLRHGFRNWEDIYPRRQRAILEALLTRIDEVIEGEDLRAALRMAVIGAAEMAGYLSRWDRWYLKSYEAMANHRFNFTTLCAEPNVWGTRTSGRGTVMRRLHQLLRAAKWMSSETRKRLIVETLANTNGKPALSSKVDVRVVTGSSESMALRSSLVDLVLTDPPYHDDVQYSELSLPFRAWSRMTTDSLVGEAVVNDATGQNSDHGAYRRILTRIFSEVRRCLKPNGHLILSYANREPEAWIDLFSAFQEARFRAVGCAVVHSENETDHAKRGVRACTLDLLMDLVPAGETPVEQWCDETNGGETAEREFLRLVQRAFLQVGNLPPDWESGFRKSLLASAFLTGRAR